MNKRNIEIYNLRLSGKTEKEVGEKFGISASRVHQIFYEVDIYYRHKERMKDDPLFQLADKNIISTNTYRSVRRSGHDTKWLISRLESGNLTTNDIRNLGAKGILELKNALLQSQAALRPAASTEGRDQAD